MHDESLREAIEEKFRHHRENDEGSACDTQIEGKALCGHVEVVLQLIHSEKVKGAEAVEKAVDEAVKNDNGDYQQGEDGEVWVSSDPSVFVQAAHRAVEEIRGTDHTPAAVSACCGAEIFRPSSGLLYCTQCTMKCEEIKEQGV